MPPPYGYYAYDAWGNVTAYTSTGGTPATTSLIYRNPLRYRGYIYDNETGFYYLQSRYYDPATHRFINADSYESTRQGFTGTNMFAYCNNSPVCYADNDGTSPFWVIIPYWGIVHQAVQVHIVSHNSGMDLLIERTVVFDDGSYGRVDLSTPSGQIWEVKHNGSAALLADSQLSHYLTGVLKNPEAKPTLGETQFSGQFVMAVNGRNLHVEYETVRDGVVLYTFYLDPKRQTVPEYSRVPVRKPFPAPQRAASNSYIPSIIFIPGAPDGLLGGDLSREDFFALSR